MGAKILAVNTPTGIASSGGKKTQLFQFHRLQDFLNLMRFTCQDTQATSKILKMTRYIMLLGFTGYRAIYKVESLSNQRLDMNTSSLSTQGITLAGGAGPGCTVECYCSLFTYTCYERCDGRVVRSWDNGWCASSW